MGTDYPLLDQREFDSSKAFLEHLSPLGPFFGRFAKTERWIYRGQADANWELLPSALRRSQRDELFRVARLGTPRNDTNTEQWRAEATVLQLFHEYADLSGSPIPEDSQEVRRQLDRLISRYTSWTHYDKARREIVVKKGDFVDYTWPPSALFSLLALAQHNGVPSRLLDWSLSPYVAAYFAAIGAISQHTDRFSVWGLFTAKHWIGDTIQRAITDQDVTLRLVTAPRASNMNLHAQNGVFTLMTTTTNGPFEDVSRKSLDQLALNGVNPRPDYGPLLTKFSIATKFAGEVLWCLDKLFINAATIYPGFRGAAEAILEFPLQRPHESL